MSGLLALLDDVAGIAKVAAASVDDVTAQALKAGSKAAGAVIDDAAVTPKYLHGFAPARELPIVWRITKGSLKNKLIFLLPAALLLSQFAPWAIAPLLMLGGAYLCFEGAEKIWHAVAHGQGEGHTVSPHPDDPSHLEEEKAQGAIKTDFILSAEIMTISLSAIESTSFWIEAVALAAVAIGITALVYGAVAALVKADDLGLKLAQDGRLSATRNFGRWLVRAMPTVMKVIATVGTAAMLWVGGNIITHGLHDLGWHWPYEAIHVVAEAVAHAVATAEGAVAWTVTAALDGVLGLGLGLMLIPVVTRVITPAVEALAGLVGRRKDEG